MPQTGIFAQLLEKPTPVFAMAVSGKEKVRFEYSELHGYFKPHSRAVVDTGKREVIPKSMQLMAGRTEQEYSQ